MAKTIRSITTTITVSSGAGSLATSTIDSWRPIRDAGGWLEQIIVQERGASSEDTFDFYTINANANVNYRRRGNTQELIDSPHIPIRGDYTLYIENATRDGTYNIELLFREEW